MCWLRTIGAALALLNVAQVPAHGAPQDATVALGIGMTRVVREARPDATGGISIAPDGRHFAVVLWTGNLNSKQNCYRLAIFEEEQLRLFLEGELSHSPAPRITYSTCSTRDRNGISHLSWSADGQFLYFLADDNDGKRRLRELRMSDGALRVINLPDVDIQTYDVSADRRLIAYSYFRAPDWKARNETGYIVGAENARQFVQTDPSRAFQSIVYALFDDRSMTSKDIASTPNGVAGARPREISISPTGRFIVINLPLERIPASWSVYPPVREMMQIDAEGIANGSAPGLVRADGWMRAGPSFSSILFGLSQYHLVDTTDMSIRTLIDAPSDTFFETVRAKWRGQDQAVILPSNFLPPGRATGQEAGPVVIQLSDGASSRASEAMPANANSAIGLEVVETRDRPPELVAANRQTGARIRISTLNPALAEADLGSSEAIQWQDRFGRKYRGLLFRPSPQEQRLPLVIAPSSYVPEDRFIFDGPSDGLSSALSIRPLVGRGIAVLLMLSYPVSSETTTSTPASYERDGELPRVRYAIEAAVEHLTRKGIVDPDRIGLLGFSRNGMYVQYALAFSELRFAAATVADSLGQTPFCYALTYGALFPSSMLEFESRNSPIDAWTVGAPFWSRGIADWIKRSYIYRLNRIRLPVRYESYGAHLPCQWDAYAIQRRQYRPVEMFHIPLAGHQLRGVEARLRSQEGNVDWFDFWLNGHEDPDPEKAEQYARWHHLRELRDRTLEAPRPPLLDWTAAPVDAN